MPAEAKVRGEVPMSLLSGPVRRRSVVQLLSGASALLLLLPSLAAAQEKGVSVRRVETVKRRLALVLGNARYQHATPLQNSVNDAVAVGRELRRIGWDVYPAEGKERDLDRKGMYDAVDDFVGRLSKDDQALVYFSGHGVQLQNTNYLIPVDLDAERPEEIVRDSISVSDVLEKITARNPAFSLVVLDACRNNPFQGRGKSLLGTRGLASPAGTPSGFVIVYAAGANQQALDRVGSDDRDPNGLFTRELLKVIREPGLTIQEAVSKLKYSVAEKAGSVGHAQHPAIYDESRGTFRFSDAAAGETPKPAPAEPSPPRVAEEKTRTGEKTPTEEPVPRNDEPKKGDEPVKPEPSGSTLPYVLAALAVGGIAVAVGVARRRSSAPAGRGQATKAVEETRAAVRIDAGAASEALLGLRDRAMRQLPPAEAALVVAAWDELDRSLDRIRRLPPVGTLEERSERDGAAVRSPLAELTRLLSEIETVCGPQVEPGGAPALAERLRDLDRRLRPVVERLRKVMESGL